MDTTTLAHLIDPNNPRQEPHVPTHPLPKDYPALTKHTKGLKVNATRQVIIPQSDYSPNDYPPNGRYYTEDGAKVFMFSVYPNVFYPALIVRVWRLA